MQGRYIGTTDESLSMQGAHDCRKIILPMADKIFCSPMKRCRETAEIIYHGQEIEIIQKFREYDFGAFENKNYEELKDQLEYCTWIESRGQENPPYGEDWKSFRERCTETFKQIVNSCINDEIETVAFIIHGGTIMSILGRFAKPLREFYDWQTKNADGWIAYTDKNEWRQKQALSVESLIKTL